MVQIDKLVVLLKKTKKMRNKYLAKRLKGKEGTNKETDKILKEECYKCLLSLLPEEVKIDLKKIDTIIGLLVPRMTSNGLWSWTGDSFVYVLDNSKVITRGENGFQGGNTLEEESFIEENQEGLSVINDLLNEKDNILSEDISLNDERNRELAISLIEFISSSSLDNVDKVRRK